MMIPLLNEKSYSWNRISIKSASIEIFSKTLIGQIIKYLTSNLMNYLPNEKHTLMVEFNNKKEKQLRNIITFLVCIPFLGKNYFSNHAQTNRSDQKFLLWVISHKMKDLSIGNASNYVCNVR